MIKGLLFAVVTGTMTVTATVVPPPARIHGPLVQGAVPYSITRERHGNVVMVTVTF